MVSLAETRDDETGMHIRRTQNYVKLLAKQLVSEGTNTSQLQPDDIALLYHSQPG